MGVRSALNIAMLVGLKYSSVDACGSKHIIFRSGQFITLTTRDGNNKLLPVAVAIVLGETAAAYKFVSTELILWGAGKYFNTADHVISSDRDKGLNELHQKLEAAWALYCFKHIIDNAAKHSGGRVKVQLAWAMQQAKTREDYLKALASMRAYSRKAAEYLDALPHEQVYFYAYNNKGVRTYAHKTNNVAEIMNWAFKKYRAEAPVWFLQGVLSWLGDQYVTRTYTIQKWMKNKYRILTSYAHEEYEKQV